MTEVEHYIGQPPTLEVVRVTDDNLGEVMDLLIDTGQKFSVITAHHDGESRTILHLPEGAIEAGGALVRPGPGHPWELNVKNRRNVDEADLAKVMQRWDGDDSVRFERIDGQWRYRSLIDQMRPIAG